MSYPVREITFSISPRRWKHIWAGFLSDKLAVLAFSIFVFYCLIAMAAPLIAPFDPYDTALIDLLNAEIAPSWISGDERFLLGTDAQGRDLLSAIVYGTRTSLSIGLLAVLMQASIGICLGLISGYFGGLLDTLLMRCADIQLSFSNILIAIVLLAAIQSIFGLAYYQDHAMIMLVFILGLAEWPIFARTVRASVLAEKQKEYVDAAYLMGISQIRIIFKHILPNTISPLFVIFTIQIANVIVAEAALSFLGLGMPISQPSLGSLISIGFDYLFSGIWWISVVPCAVLMLLILVINLLGDVLKNHLNPRHYKD
ncbi:ABC transporter permease [Marinomonas agarivorans]|nr:ABC transporter permease [Marinomonas agarivorans]